MGPSGSGKSTLLACLAGLQPVTAGELYVYGTRLDEAKPRELAEAPRQHGRRRRAGRAQGARRRPGASARGSRCGAAGRASAQAGAQRASELLERVGLEGREKAKRSELSGGEQQRAALCVAIAVKPKLLLVDEVTGQLDAATGRAILELLAQLAQRGARDGPARHPRPAGGRPRDPRGDDPRRPPDRRAARHKRPPLGLRRRRRPDPPRPRRPAHGGDRGRRGGRDRPRRGGAQRHGQAAAARASPRARPTRAGEELVRLEHVRRRFRTKAETVDAVAGVTLALKAGAFHALVGPSGCGKTTLLHLIAGLDRPDHGRVTLAGTDLSTHDPRRARRAARRSTSRSSPRSRALVAGLSARDNVALGLRARGVERQAGPRQSARRACRRSASASSPSAPPSGLSGGERQRVALARALATDAPPDRRRRAAPANLDEANAIRVAELLAQRARRPAPASSARPTTPPSRPAPRP